MAASLSNCVFLYPDPSLSGLKAPSPQSHPHPHHSTVFSGSNSPAAPVVAGAAPAPPVAREKCMMDRYANHPKP